jgi:hypothetical protein
MAACARDARALRRHARHRDARSAFAKGKGARGCTKHRVCTPPTAINSAGEYQTKPAAPHHDRV